MSFASLISLTAHALPWQEGPARRAFIDSTRAIARAARDLPPTERLAVLGNDGTQNSWRRRYAFER